jgi:AAA ATPase-like protein
MSRVWPLIGRDEQLRSVERTLDGSRTTVVTGNPGSGKTRLAAEVVRSAQGKRFATAWVAGTTSMSHIPLGAFAHLLADPLPQDPQRAVAELLIALKRRAGERRLVVAVDDAHLLDDYSADVVCELAATPGVSIVLTLRHREPVSDAVAKLWKEGEADRLDIWDLGWADVHELLFRALAGPVSMQTVERLWEATKGNVLHLRELVRRGIASGTLARHGGVWDWSHPLPPESDEALAAQPVTTVRRMAPARRRAALRDPQAVPARP